jgi:hypothetical protein
MFYYAFDEAEFGVHGSGEPIPVTQPGLLGEQHSRGDRILHYEPNALFYIGLVVEYFKQQKAIFKQPKAA